MATNSSLPQIKYMEKELLNYNKCRKNRDYRFQVYESILRYYYSRIEENHYYESLTTLERIKNRFSRTPIRKYNPAESNLSIGYVLRRIYPDAVCTCTITFLQYYFPELYDNRMITLNNRFFTNDSERINALEQIVFKYKTDNPVDII